MQKMRKMPGSDVVKGAQPSRGPSGRRINEVASAISTVSSGLGPTKPNSAARHDKFFTQIEDFEIPSKWRVIPRVEWARHGGILTDHCPLLATIMPK